MRFSLRGTYLIKEEFVKKFAVFLYAHSEFRLQLIFCHHTLRSKNSSIFRLHLEGSIPCQKMSCIQFLQPKSVKLIGLYARPVFEVDITVFDPPSHKMVK